MTPIQISIVIPVFNSSRIIGELFEAVCSNLSQLTFEVIMVNDGSRDDSWNTICGLASENPQITGIDLRYNSGQDNAIMAGIRESKGEFVVIMDDDLQHDPADIPMLLAKCREGYDAVYAGFENREQSLIRQAGSRFNSGFARWLIRKPRGLYLSPYKILTRRMADEVAGFVGPYPYIDGILLTLTTRIGQITATHHKRHSGQSNYNIRRSAGVWFKLFTGFSVAPLRIAALSGFVIALTGLVLAAFYLFEYFFTNRSIEGWTTIVLLLIFFGGVNLMVLGLLGEFVGRIYLTLNGKPQYSIRNIIRSDEART